MSSQRDPRPGTRRALSVALLLVPALAAAGVAGISPSIAGGLPGIQQGSGPPHSLRVGTKTLQRCGTSPASYCGTLKVPLDWESANGPDISVCFRWFPATGGGRPDGTVLPVEGGPGYPSILSVAPDGYRAMYGPILRHFNMLAVDLRGTGCSTLLDCPTLQDFVGQSGTPAFAAVVGACADALNERWKAPGGGFVHASDLFTSAPAAEDLAAVIQALEIPEVDVYGDSYGSWFGQVFAARYPSLVRSLTLDSTYPVLELDPWYRITLATMPASFDTACAGSVACASAGGTSWPRIEALAARLASAPISGKVPGPNGRLETVRMGIVGLVNLVSDSAEDPAIYRGLDAAARALLEDNQPAPLLRLFAQRLAIDEAYFGVPVNQYSVESYMAVSCLDYPQLYPLSVGATARTADLAAAEATLPANTFAPFTTAQWLAMDQNTENYTACLDWPKPAIAQPPLTTSPPLLPASMPVLILGGALDTWTPPAGVPEVQAEIGGDQRFVELANETHVVGEGDPYGCASSIIQSFVVAPAGLASLDVSCASSVPSIRAVGSYANELSSVLPVTLTSGTESAIALQLAAAAVLTAGDAASRFESIGVTDDAGLYGGSVTASGGRLTLADDELVPGVMVSGTVTISGTTVTTALRTRAPGLAAVHAAGSWPLFGGSATAALSVSSGGASASGSMPAP